MKMDKHAAEPRQKIKNITAGFPPELLRELDKYIESQEVETKRPGVIRAAVSFFLAEKRKIK